MARKKPAISPEEFLHMLHPDLPTSDDIAPKVEEKKLPTADEQIAALTQQVSQLTEQLGKQPRQIVQTPQETKQQRQAPAAPSINWAAMPDPIRDPAGYTQFVQGTVKAQVDYEKELYNFQQGEANQARARTDTIWNDFARGHADYAANEKRIEIATTQVLQRVTAGGGDTDAFMANRGAFFAAITDEYDDLFGKPAGDNDDDDTDDDGGDDDDNRAQIFGGSAAGPKGPTDTPREQPAKLGALGQEIRSWQERTGFYR